MYWEIAAKFVECKGTLVETWIHKNIVPPHNINFDIRFNSWSDDLEIILNLKFTNFKLVIFSNIDSVSHSGRSFFQA